MPQRYIVIVMTLLALINAIGMRSSLYLVLTQMAKPNPNAGPIDEHSCPVPDDHVSAVHNSSLLAADAQVGTHPKIGQIS